MSSIKVVDVNHEEAKQDEIEEAKEEVNEVSNEEAKEEVNEITNEGAQEEKTTKPQTEELQPEKLKNNSKSERLKDKNITCPKCNKTMLLRSYRYKHELNCQGKLEDRAIKPKAKPKPKPQPIIQDVEEEIPQLTQPVKKQILKPTNPLADARQSLASIRDARNEPHELRDITNHYQLLQQQYIQQKKEKYNNLCQSMFSAKSKKR